MDLHSPIQLQSKESLASALVKAPDRLEVALPMQTGCGVMATLLRVLRKLPQAGILLSQNSV